MAAFLSNRLPAVIVKPLQHVPDLHREDGNGCLMRVLYGLRHAQASTQALRRKASICLSQ
ncbi:MAG: hypothetical protein HYY76_15395 [Acidobacteria bacterium]|nr:hypothetical protein [Acidobacteriota bacterium]